MIEDNRRYKDRLFNPNMPLRFLQYMGNLYEKYVKQRKVNKYGSKLLSLPVPRLIVFYNGKMDQPAHL